MPASRLSVSVPCLTMSAPQLSVSAPQLSVPASHSLLIHGQAPVVAPVPATAGTGWPVQGWLLL